MNKKLALIALMAIAALVWGKPASGKSAVGSFKDSRDGRIYKTVKIGDQVWMAQNLNYGKAMRVTAKPTVGQKYCLDNVLENCEQRGGLYTWEMALQSCPKGWHLPTKAEWTKLVHNVTSICDNFESLEGECNGASVHESLLQAAKIDGVILGKDDFGFGASPSGDISLKHYDEDGRPVDSVKHFREPWYVAFWSSTTNDEDSTRADVFGFDVDGKNISTTDNYFGRLYKNINAIGVRCLKD